MTTFDAVEEWEALRLCVLTMDWRGGCHGSACVSNSAWLSTDAEWPDSAGNSI